jgi:hypothetical protein
MMFLNPAVLLGLLAASIPVLIHLLNLRKLQRIEFSTLTFLKELQKNKIKKIKLKQWLLLLLRVLIIIFIILGFARPALKGIAIGGTTSAAKTTAVFIIDDTFSMSVIDTKGSYFNQAKSAIKDLLNNLQEGDKIAIIKVSSAGSDEINLTSNLVDFRKQIDDLQISDKSGKLNAAIVKAAEVISTSNNFNKEIYLFSDFQKGNLADDEELSNLSQALNERIKLYAFDYSGKDVFNISIDELNINSQIFEKNKSVNFSATVSNHSGRGANNTVVSLFINGERSAQQSVNLQSGQTQIITMETPVKHYGFVDVFVGIEDDDILNDNIRYTSLYIPEEIPLIIFESNAGEAKFVYTALTLSNNGQTIKATIKNISEINSVDLSRYRVVVLIGDANLQNSSRIKSYVNDGGGLILMPGSETELSSFNDFIKSIGIAAAIGEAGKVKGDYLVRFGEVDFGHPLFQNIFLKDEKKQIESPEIYHHYKLSSAAGRSIIKLADGSVFLCEYKLEAGKVLVVGAAPVLSWSTFPLKSIFVPFFTKSVFYLSAVEQSGQKYFTGDEILLNLKGKSVPQLKVVHPDKREEIINIENSAGDYIRYNKTTSAGIYQFYNGTELIDFVSVNTIPGESITEYLSMNDFREYLKKIYFKGSFVEINKDEDVSATIMQARFGTELWKTFLLIALILAAIEMLVARSAKKDLAQV